MAVADLASYGDELLVATRFDDGASSALCAVSLDAGGWRTVSELEAPSDLVVSSAEGRAFVAGGWDCAIAAIDLATGTRHPLSDLGIPPGCHLPRVLAHDPVGERLVVSFSVNVEGGSYTSPHVIDLETGDVTRIPLDYSVPSYAWEGLTLDHHGYGLIAVDGELEALVAIDPASGQMIVLAR